jgi:2-oxoglutarate dehydrogenase E1 component
MDKYSYIANATGSYIEELYADYQKDPNSVDESWSKFFEGFEFQESRYVEDGDAPVAKSAGGSDKEVKVYRLIRAYRSRGHLRSTTNPVRQRKDRNPGLDLEDYGLTTADLETVFNVGNEIGIGPAKLKDIIGALKHIYEGNIGFEYMYIRHRDRQDWFRERIEKKSLSYKPNPDNVKRILSKLNEAVVFENFLHTKYIGQKRFSLEGGETTIPALDALVQKGSELGVEEFVIGMAHRGRLNILCNIMGKTYEQIFNEFEGAAPDSTMGDGDVKYHMGFSSVQKTSDGREVMLKLMPNPSHLEAVNPVVEGYSRSKIDRLYEGDASKVCPILVHGDAAVAGQGIVYEVTQMQKLAGYKTGGTIHFVINNQVGFTTDFEDARSSIYCTDVAKVIDAPVLHVNGDDPEAVVFCMKLAMEYRQKFERDVFVDMVCYRRHGHNEADEPKFTQPTLYNVISKHSNPREIYNKMLIDRGDIQADLAKQMDKEFRAMLQDRLNMVKQKTLPYKFQETDIEWKELRKATEKDFETSPDTSISKEVIDKVGVSLTNLPDGFKPIKQIDRVLKNRKVQFNDTRTFDWASAELMAYGSLMLEGNKVRLSGQDVQRGTFSHRHAVIKDADTNESFNNLNSLESEAKFDVYNSFLSEYGVLGFEYGYAMANPNVLTIWEAQFGDFANGAQTMIDQFVASGETKWLRMNGLVMQLPHGQEGQGPEHSSARLERFLKGCANLNNVVINPTTPANQFHALRRQLKWNFRKPLIVMSPKSLLRHPMVISPEKDFTEGRFQEVIDDTTVKANDVKRILFCSGKVFYDLLEEQTKGKHKDVAIVRIEQLYPFPYTKLDEVLSKYSKHTEVAWVQDEPFNAGAWGFILRALYDHHMDVTKVKVIARDESSSPAVGYMKTFKAIQQELVEEAFGDFGKANKNAK